MILLGKVILNPQAKSRLVSRSESQSQKAASKMHVRSRKLKQKLAMENKRHF